MSAGERSSRPTVDADFLRWMCLFFKPHNFSHAMSNKAAASSVNGSSADSNRRRSTGTPAPPDGASRSIPLVVGLADLDARSMVSAADSWETDSMHSRCVDLPLNVHCCWVCDTVCWHAVGLGLGLGLGLGFRVRVRFVACVASALSAYHRTALDRSARLFERELCLGAPT